MEKEDAKIKHDYARFTFSTLTDQIKQADTKAFGILGILGVLTAGLLSRLNTLKSAVGINPTWIVLFIISAILIIVALKAVIRVVFPRLSTNQLSERSILYFKDIVAQPKQQYVHRATTYTTEKLLEELYKDIYNISNIVDAKFASLRKALILTIITFAWTIAIILLSYK
jgi:hypothetical protein